MMGLAAAHCRTRFNRTAVGRDTGRGLVFAPLAGGDHQRGHDVALECPAARFEFGRGGGLHQCATADHRSADSTSGKYRLAGSPAGSGVVVFLRHAAGAFRGYSCPVPAGLIETVPKKSFGPTSALGSRFKSSAYFSMHPKGTSFGAPAG